MRVIYLGPRLLRSQAPYPPCLAHGANLNGRVYPLDGEQGLFGLAPGGVYQAIRSLVIPVSSYLAFSPLPTRFLLGVRSFEFGERSQPPNASLAIRNFRRADSGIFSVALSLPDVPQCRRSEQSVLRTTCLWSSDFPPPRSRHRNISGERPLFSFGSPFLLSLSILL